MHRRLPLFAIIVAVLVGAITTAIAASADSDALTRANAESTCAGLTQPLWATQPVAADVETSIGPTGQMAAVVYHAGTEVGICMTSGNSEYTDGHYKSAARGDLRVLFTASNIWQAAWVIAQSGPTVKRVTMVTNRGLVVARPLGDGLWMGYLPYEVPDTSINSAAFDGEKLVVGSAQAFNASGLETNVSPIALCPPNLVSAVIDC